MRKIAKKPEIRRTPKHGRWLDMAGIELSVLSRQCLNLRVESTAELTREVAAWEDQRNERRAIVNWQFATAGARIKLRRL